MTLPSGVHRLYSMAPRKRRTGAAARSKRAATGRAKKPKPSQGLDTASHLTDEDLQNWAINDQVMNEPIAVVVEHILACGHCRERAERIRESVWGMEGPRQRLFGS